MASLLIPLGLAFLMAAVGLETRLAAFSALARAPRAVLGGLVLQVVALPLLAAALARALDLAPVHAVGLVLLAAAPGGVTANFVTLMARGDVALSVVLTVVTSLLAPLTVPLWVGAAFGWFADASVEVRLPLGPTVGAIFVTTVVPLLATSFLAERNPALAERLRPAARRLSMLVFAAIVTAAILAQWSALVLAWRTVGLAALGFDLAGLALVAIFAALAAIDRARAAALVLSTGLRNVAVALTVAVTVLGRPDLAVAATVYVVVMNAVALVFVAWSRRRLPDVKDGEGEPPLSGARTTASANRE